LWLQEKLPKAKEGGEPIPEGLLWLLMTGEVRGALGWAGIDVAAAFRSALHAQHCCWCCTFPPPWRCGSHITLLQVPSSEQAASVTEMLRQRSKVPDHVYRVRGWLPFFLPPTDIIFAAGSLVDLTRGLHTQQELPEEANAMRHAAAL
jgi:hypothetical protein